MILNYCCRSCSYFSRRDAGARRKSFFEAVDTPISFSVILSASASLREKN